MRERRDQARDDGGLRRRFVDRWTVVERWFLFTGGRLTVSAVLLGAVFLSLIALSTLRPFDMRELLAGGDAVRELFLALLRGGILLVSIVVSINSIVFSQEITDVQHQRERIDASIEYRQHIEDLIDADVSPTQPADFLGAILLAIAETTRSLSESDGVGGSEAFDRAVTAFSKEVMHDVEVARRRLEAADQTSFAVLMAGLEYDYTGQLTAARRLRREYGDALPETDDTELDRLIDTLEFYAVGREYFKSLYYERELARLSSRLLYAALPVIVFTSYVVLAIDAQFVSGETVFGLSPLLAFVSGAYTVALAPFVILTAYVARLAAVTLLTLAAGPFVVGSDERFMRRDWLASASEASSSSESDRE